MLKQQWLAKLGSTGTRLRHLYQGNTCTGMRYDLYVIALVSEGREKGREIVLEMTSAEALKFALELRLRALENDNRNKEEGLS